MYLHVKLEIYCWNIIFQSNIILSGKKSVLLLLFVSHFLFFTNLQIYKWTTVTLISCWIVLFCSGVAQSFFVK